MNQFEERINALRLQHKAERMQIQQDCDELFTRLNRVIATCSDPDARRILRAEKARVWLATQRSLNYEMKCYRQQLALISAERDAYFDAHPSKRAARRALRTLHRFAMNLGDDNKRIALAVDDTIKAEIAFE